MSVYRRYTYSSEHSLSDQDVNSFDTVARMAIESCLGNEFLTVTKINDEPKHIKIRKYMKSMHGGPNQHICTWDYRETVNSITHDQAFMEYREQTINAYEAQLLKDREGVISDEAPPASGPAPL